VLEKRVLRRVVLPKSGEKAGELIKRYNEELNDLNSLPNIIRVIKSRRIKWLVHGAVMGKSGGAYRVLVGGKT
jgi:hypothetical protein